MKNIYKIIFLCLLTSVLCPPSSFSQTAPGIEWQNTIGGNNYDWLTFIEQTADGGYILGGTSGSSISGDKTENCIGGYDYWIVKTDTLGNIQWQNTIGGSGDDWFYSMQQTADGGYILGGYSDSYISGDKTENNIGNGDYWIVKTDSLGNIQWQNTIGGSGFDWLYSIQQTADGGYILGGHSNSNISGDKTENNIDTLTSGTFDYWIVKTDSSGNIQWENTIGGSNDDRLYSTQQTADGGYILGGYSWSGISGDKTENKLDTICIPYCTSDYWIVKTDSLGNIQWQNTIGGNNNDNLYSIQQTTDEGYILGGQSKSNISGDKTESNIDTINFTWDYWIVKTDSLGNIQWQNTIGGSRAEQLRSISQTADRGYILGGYSESDISGDKTENCIGFDDYWPVKIDSLGNVRWQNTIGGTSNDYLFPIRQTADGGYILGGYSKSNISSDKTENCIGFDDYWIIKLFPDTITGISQLPQFPNYPITISPNPLTTQSKLTFKNPNKEKFLFTLYDITGRVTESVSTTNNEIILTKGSKPAGVYLLDLMNEKTRERWNGKIVISD
jgi:hypothetical protein